MTSSPTNKKGRVDVIKEERELHDRHTGKDINFNYPLPLLVFRRKKQKHRNKGKKSLRLNLIFTVILISCLSLFSSNCTLLPRPIFSSQPLFNVRMVSFLHSLCPLFLDLQDRLPFDWPLVGVPGPNTSPPFLRTYVLDTRGGRTPKTGEAPLLYPPSFKCSVGTLSVAKPGTGTLDVRVGVKSSRKFETRREPVPWSAPTCAQQRRRLTLLPLSVHQSSRQGSVHGSVWERLGVLRKPFRGP